MSGVDSIGLPESGTRSAETRGRGLWWVWLLILAVGVAGFWYYRSSRSSAAIEAQPGAAGAPGGAGGGGRRGAGAGMGNFSVPVVVATAQHGDLPVYYEGLGTVTAFNTVTVRTRVDGQIMRINFTEGQMVHEGDSLIEIDPRPFQVQLEQAEGQLAKDVASQKDAQVNLDRYKILYDEGVIPKQQYDTQGATVGQFDGAIKSDQAQIDNAKLQITYCHITAPITGRIGLRLVDIGNIVHATDANGLLVITQLQPIAVIFALPQDQLPQVATKLRAAAQLTVDAYDRDNLSKIESGKLLTIDNQIDPTTGTYKLKAIFNNANNILFPNQFVNIHLLVDVKKNLTIVPAAAIQRGPQGTYVYAVQNGNTAKIENVTIAQTTGNSIGLSGGITGGDVVVVDGQDKLQDGSKITPTQQQTPTQSNAQNASGTQQQGPVNVPQSNAVPQGNAAGNRNGFIPPAPPINSMSNGLSPKNPLIPNGRNGQTPRTKRPEKRQR
jgi:multidrug efflux system membrane fusion protein